MKDAARSGKVTAASVKRALKAVADPDRARHSRRFFRTGPGEYGEGDRFLGVVVPEQRRVARAHQTLAQTEIEKLLHSPIHEHRLTALLILVLQFEHADSGTRTAIYSLCITNLTHIDNWDLVDTAAPRIGGAYLLSRRDKQKILLPMARSRHLWTRRWAVMCTFAFIRAAHYSTTLELASILLDDDADLIHKAAGWMLREIGNRDRDVELAFLDKNAANMPRTMLRYAIEKFPEPLRHAYLSVGGR